MQEKIKTIIEDVLEKLGLATLDFIVEHPEEGKNGDYSTNAALVCAKRASRNPRELAEEIVSELRQHGKEVSEIQEIEVAGPGFINFRLSREFFRGSVEAIVNQADEYGKNRLLAGKKIMIEYTDPNPFKPFHIGHLMTNAIGESVARVLEYSGAQVSRANYQGDVGLHVAKAIYGLLENPDWRERKPTREEEARNIGKAYVFGSNAYDEDPQSKKEIDEINKKVYAKSDEEINGIYDWGFSATMEAFESLYKILGTKFDYYFLESVVAQIGKEIVESRVGEVFEESEGALVFKAEKYDPKLHTRVFVTSQGLPTYETKELGLAEEKWKTNPDMDLSVIITANEQMDYMRVVQKAISLINPEHASKTKHITHGMMRLAGGKMSSRKGNIVTGESMLFDTISLIADKMKDRGWDEEEKRSIAEAVGVAAIKYSILRSQTGGDIVFNPEESVSVEGDSGPYLQYSYARANSILEKAKNENILPDPHAAPVETFEIEKMLYRFPEIVLRSAKEYEPHYVATYLIGLARSFNAFYGTHTIVDREDATSAYKVALTFAFSFVMKSGLHLLGIKAPAKM